MDGGGRRPSAAGGDGVDGRPRRQRQSRRPRRRRREVGRLLMAAHLRRCPGRASGRRRC